MLWYQTITGFDPYEIVSTPMIQHRLYSLYSPYPMSRRARVVDIGKLQLFPMKDAVSKLIRVRTSISTMGLLHSGYHHSGLSLTFATGD
jgi:hypothetical protein